MASGFRFDTSAFKLGKFNSNNRFVREVTNPADATMTLVVGPSFAISSNGSDIEWRWECGPVTRVGASGLVVPPAAGFSTSKKIAI